MWDRLQPTCIPRVLASYAGSDGRPCALIRTTAAHPASLNAHRPPLAGRDMSARRACAVTHLARRSHRALLTRTLRRPQLRREIPAVSPHCAAGHGVKRRTWRASVDDAFDSVADRRELTELRRGAAGAHTGASVAVSSTSIVAPGRGQRFQADVRRSCVSGSGVHVVLLISGVPRGGRRGLGTAGQRPRPQVEERGHQIEPGCRWAQTALTRSACGPFWPCVTSNSTRWFSSRDR
jgi:hypothetical protein